MSSDYCLVNDSHYYIQTAERFKAGLGPTIVLESGKIVYNSIWPLGYPSFILIGLYLGLNGIWASKLVNLIVIIWVLYELNKTWADKAPILALSLLAFIKVLAFSWSESLLFAFTLSFTHGIWHAFHNQMNFRLFFWIFITGFGMFFTKYIGGISAGLIFIAALLAYFTNKKKLMFQFLILGLLLILSFGGYFFISEKLSNHIWGGTRFIAVEPWPEWTLMVLSSLANELLLIRDWDNFYSVDFIGLLGFFIQGYIIYKLLKIRVSTPEKANPHSIQLTYWYLVVALVLGVTLIILRAFSPFDPLDIRLMAPSTFFLLLFVLGHFAALPIYWRKVQRYIFFIFALSSICALLPKKFNPLKPLEKLSIPTQKIYLLFILIGLFSPFLASAQTFGNEWINYEQSYFRIPIAQKGVYRITSAELQKAGFNTGIDPRMIQLYWRGKEQSIFVEGEQDRKLDASDYIEFYAEGNDGAPDSLLYIPNSAQPHPYFSLYSDSTAYFLTYSTTGKAGKRMDSYRDTDYSSLTPEAYHLEEILKLYTSDYPVGFARPVGTLAGAMLFSHYDYGEGWTGPVRSINEEWQENFTITDLATSAATKPRVEWLMTGRLPDNHRLVFSAGSASRTLGEGFFEYYYTKKFSFPLEFSDISNQTLVLKTVSKGVNNGSRDAYSATYARVTYPQLTRMNGLGSKTFQLIPQSAGRSYLSIPGSNNASLLAYDITDKNEVRRIGGLPSDTDFQVIVRGTQAARKVLITREFKSVPLISRTSFRNINPKSHNYLIITHPALQKPAGSESDAVRAYARYRASEAGGKYDTLTVSIFQLYDQFNYGETSPLAIRRFLDFMLRKGNPQSVFLIGQSTDPQGLRFSPNRNQIDMVPSSGWPGSDITMTMGLNGKGIYEPAIPIGRLQTNSPQTVLDYLAKVKEHESKPMTDLWQKNILHLSGGRSSYELLSFRNNLNQLQQTAQNKLLGTRVELMGKKTDEPVEFLNIQEQVNSGLSMITFFGHSSPTVSDIEIGMASNEQLGYRNNGKYPLIFMNGCASGNFYFQNSKTFGTDWVNTPNKGAILFLALTDIGYPFVLKEYADQIYNGLFSDSTTFAKPFGYIQQQAVKRFLANNSDFYHVAHAEQFTLQGDPAIVLYPASKLDYAIKSQTLFVQGLDKKALTIPADSFRVGIVISNLGKNVKKPFSVNLKRTLSNGREIDLGTKQYAPIAYQDTIYFTVNNQAHAGGNTRFDVVIDANNQLDEISKQNNKASLNVVLPGSLARPLLPHDFAIIGTQENNTPTARLVAEYTPVATISGTPQIIFELDTSAAFTSSFKKTTTLPISNTEGWKVSLLATDSTVYFWRVRSADQALSNNNQWSTASFTYIKGSTGGWAQSNATQFDNVLTDFAVLQNNRWSFTGTATAATLSSALIGPANQWGAIRQQVTRNAQQKSSLDVYGVDNQGNETLLYANLTSSLTDIKNGVDAKKYPYLRLREKISGPTAPQLNRWLVSYQEVPEGALHLKGQSAYVPNTTTYLTEGAPYTQNLSFDLASTQLFADSLTVTEVVTNATSGLNQTRQYKVNSAKTIPLSIAYANLATGENRIAVTVNPQVLPEVSYTNNLITLIAHVQPDRSAPILEVTFDGKTIPNGSFVSANPTIAIRLKDENKYVLRKDTSGIDMYLQRRFPDTTALQRISFQNPNVSWQMVSENDFRATYQPKNLPEGTYYFQVNGSDATGNLAGSTPYNITFVVKNETGIQQLVVSPNPLTYYTRFSLNLTGTSVPDAMAIEIYNLQGQLLRIISNENQKLQIGQNDYYWDGTDQRGSRLPIGTYIYKLKIQEQGQSYPFLDPNTKTSGRVIIVR
ncbi:flagellar hook assembly protein FlgD [Siphonobacter sp. BAB-5404]|nr:flagellar hook assembly protein FlgD [Siphonobacter sp. SORGH_AS_0500]